MNISISVVFIFILMCLNVLSVCSTAFILSLHLINPAPLVPSWLRRLTTDHKSQVADGSIKELPMEGSSHKPGRKIENHPKQEMPQLVKMCEEVLTEVKKITRKQNEIMKENALQEEWKNIAKVLNKGLFVTLLVILGLLITTVGALWFRAHH